MLNKTAMDKIGAKVQTAVLSPETVKKQHRVHKELAAQEYAMVQQVLDAGEQIQDGQQNLVYFLEQPKGYVAIVKTTRTGQGLFVTSFRRLSQDQAKRDKEIQRLKGKAK